MAAHAKFLFDVPLDGYRGGRSRAEEDAARAVEAARQQAFAEGVAEGRRQQAAEGEDALERLAGEIARNSATILADLDAERERLAREAAGLAFAAAATLAPALVAREPHGELDALFSECVANLANAPHLVIRVPEDTVAPLRERLERVAHGAGYDGRIVALQDEEMSPGDCSIEWADGGVTRSLSQMMALVRQAVERRYGPLEPPAAEAATQPADAPDAGDGEGEQ